MATRPRGWRTRAASARKSRGRGRWWSVSTRTSPPTLADRKGRTSASQRTSTRSPATTSVATRCGANSFKKPGPPPRSCREEEATGGLGGHAEEEPPVGEAGDVGRPVGALAIADGNLHDAEVELGRAEDEIEVAEGIEVAEMRPARREPRVVLAPDHFGAAQRVLDRLADETREEEPEEAIAQEIEEAHGPRVHAVDEARAHGELARARDHRLVELRQVLGGDREVGVEDHQQITRSVGEAQPDRVALALAG